MGQLKIYNGQVNIFVFKAEMYGGFGKAHHEEWDSECLDIRITHNELDPLDPAVSERLSTLSCSRKPLLNYLFQGLSRSWAWTVNATSLQQSKSDQERKERTGICVCKLRRDTIPTLHLNSVSSFGWTASDTPQFPQVI